MPTPGLLRPVAALAAGALLATTLTTVLAGPAQADRADDGATWLESQLTGSLVHNDQFDSDDYGLTLDFGFGLKAVGGHGATARAIRDEMTEHVADYTGAAPGERYAGPIAKLAAYAQATGADPRDFGGDDLIKQLNARVADSRPIVGRIRDKSDFGDFANTIGQAYAARALKLAGSRKAGKAIRFLLKQQCAAGFFRLSFAAARADRQTCDAARKSKQSPDTDATALAVINLRAIPRQERSTATRAADRRRHLLAEEAAEDERQLRRRNEHREAAMPTAPVSPRGRSESPASAGPPRERRAGCATCRCLPPQVLPSTKR